VRDGIRPAEGFINADRVEVRRLVTGHIDERQKETKASVTAAHPAASWPRPARRSHPAPAGGVLIVVPVTIRALPEGKPRLAKKTGASVGQREALEVSGLTISPNRARCIWFRALPVL
jgi:hypothetical protein